MRTIVLAALFAFCSTTSAGEIAKVTLPAEVLQELKVSPSDPDIKGKVWNRWTSKNFVVCALNDNQAQYMNRHLELVKTWVYQRWGLYDTEFSAECRIICVDDTELYRKMFRLDQTRVETRRENDGRLKLNVIFLLGNQLPSIVLPTPLTEVCLVEFEQKYRCRLGWWSHRGMASLNCSLENIKTGLLELKPVIDSNSQMFFSRGLLDATKEVWEGFDQKKRDLYDRGAASLCLLIRKEFGQDVFLAMATKGPQGAIGINEILGFKDEAQFDRTFKRYMTDIVTDLMTGKTPSSYLQIKEK